MMQRLTDIALVVLALGMEVGVVPTRADEKGDALLQQIKATVQTLEPLVGEYDVIFHEAAGDQTDKYEQSIGFGAGWGGSGCLPRDAFNLFDPITQVPATTRYLGRQTVRGEIFDVVELRQPQSTLRLFIGSDGLIHRAFRTSVASPAPGSPTLRPSSTGKFKTPVPNRASATSAKTSRTSNKRFSTATTQTTKLVTAQSSELERVTPAVGNGPGGIEIVVTSYRKGRASASLPDLPPPARRLKFLDVATGKKHYPLRVGLSPDGSRMAVVFKDGVVQIVEAERGAALVTLEGSFSLVSPVFAPDGKRLAIATNEGGLLLYDATTGHKLLTLPDVHLGPAPVFSPDGRLLAGTDYNHKVTVWNVDSGKPLAVIAREGLHGASFSSDGTRLFTQQHTAKSWIMTEWNIADAKTIAREIGHRIFPGSWEAHTLSPDGKWLALSRQNGSLSVFDAQTGAKLRDLPQYRGFLASLQFADDGKTLFTLTHYIANENSIPRIEIVVRDTATWQSVVAGSLPEDAFWDVISSPYIARDGRSFVHSDLSRGIRVWGVANLRQEERKSPSMAATCPNNADTAEVDIACKYKGDAYRLGGRIVRRENVSNEENPFTTAFQADPTTNVDYRFPTGLCADLCAYFNPFAAPAPNANPASNPIQRPNPEPNPSAEWKTLPSETIDGISYRVMETRNLPAPPEPPHSRGVPLLPRVRLRRYVDSSGQIRRMTGEFQRFGLNGKAPDPNPLVMEATFRLRLPNNSIARATSAPPARVTVAVPEADSRVLALTGSPMPLLATADDFGNITIRNVNTGEPLHRLKVPEGERSDALAFSQNGRLLAATTWRETLQLWELDTGKPVSPAEVGWRGNDCVALSPDGSLLAAHMREEGHGGDNVGVWNVATGKRMTYLEGADGEEIAFSPDGKMLAVRSRDSIGLWDTATWRPQAVLATPVVAILGSAKGNSLAFSPDSRLLAVGDVHRTRPLSHAEPFPADAGTSVHVWDVRTHQKLQTLRGTTGPILALAFAPDGRTLAVVDHDTGAEGPGHNSAVLLWDTQTWQQVGTIAVDHGPPIERLAWTADGATIITSYHDTSLKFWAVPKR